MAKDIKVTLELDNSQFKRALNQSEQQVKGFSSNSVSSLGNIRNAFIALGGAAVIKGVADVGASFQDLQNSLNVVFGSVDAGADAFQRVQNFAATTQFSVQTLTQAFVQLKGAGVEPTEDLLQTFADTASVTTDQMGTFQAALDLVSRSTAGGLGLEDLNRLADRGIPVFQILQERLGLARLEVSEFGKTAEGANSIIRELLAGLQEDFGGALETQVGNLNYELNQLGDAFDKLQVALFGTFSDDAANAVRGLTDAINRLADNTDAIESFVNAIKGIGVALLGFGAIKFLNKGFGAFFDLILGRGKKVNGVGKDFKNLGNNLRFVKMKTDDLKKSQGTYITKLIKDGKTITSTSVLVQRLVSAFAALRNTLVILLRFTGLAGLLFGIASAVDALTEALFGFSAFRSIGNFLNPFKKSLDETSEAVMNNAHVLEYQKEQQRINEEAARANAEAKKLAQEAEEAFERGLRSSTNAIQEQTSAFDKNDPLFTYQELLASIFEEAKANVNGAVDLQRALRNVQALLDLDPTNAYFLEALRIIKERIDESNPTLEDFNTLLEKIAKTTDNYNMLLERLVELQTIGKISAEEFERAKKQLDEAFTENEAIDNFLETLGRAQKRLSEDLASAFLEGKSAAESFKNFFKTIVQQIIADIIRLAIIQPILASILGPFGYGFGTGGNIIKLASGGPAMANKPYLVGEEGPELFVPGASGQVVPNDALGMGRTNITYNINAVDTQSFQQAIARDPEFIYAVTQAGSRRLPR